MDEKKKIHLRKSLLYKCTHRGKRELDLILGGYAKENIMNLSDKQLNELRLILNYDDHSLFLYVTNKQKPPNLILNKTMKSIILFNKKLNNN